MKKKPAKLIHKIIFVLFIILIIFVVLFLGKHLLEIHKQDQTQKAFSSFYTPSSPVPDGKPGDIVKKEKMDLNVPNLKTAYRVLYITQLPNGEKTISSGMIFVPTGEPPVGGRPVLAWAHGTVGMGAACAPSRSDKPLGDMDWLSDALARGWIVSATDYSGLGTPGTLAYLVGDSEAHDVLNSVRAAQNLSDANASNRFLLFGHSQGGHSVLFSAKEAQAYAPELSLVAAAAAAPAAQLPSLISEQYNKSIIWGLGPEIAVSWPKNYPDLNLSETLTSDALSSYKSLSQECLNGNISGIFSHIALKQKFFKSNPITNISWKNVALDQNAPFLSSQTPLIIAQGLSDTVVIPNTTALYAKEACENGSNLTMMWMNGIGHIPAANTSGAYIVSWLEQRLEGIPAVSTCNQPMPIAPATLSN